jgi:hypothetical protein
MASDEEKRHQSPATRHSCGYAALGSQLMQIYSPPKRGLSNFNWER